MISTPLVSVKCLVYNHEPYLRQCLDGIVMQQTNFPFEAIVHDDASTDGSAAIIHEYAEKYPDIIKPIIEKENQYSKKDGSMQRIINEQIRGKYIAICEGDDYWIDPLKLQKQVDLMESHSEYGLVYTSAYVNNNGTLNKKTVLGYEIGKQSGLVGDNPIPTVTSLFRTELYNRFCYEIQPYTRGWMMTDKPFWFYIRLRSKVKYLSDITSVYRVLDNSASHSTDLERMLKFRESSRDINLFFIDNFIKDKIVCQKEKLMTYRSYYSSVTSLYIGHGVKDMAKKIYNQGKKYMNWSVRLRFGAYIYIPFVWNIRKRISL